ncbi:SMI1/KNR4 family protein [Streptosporangium sp. NPDC006007]|uniref:SMI1/KNR4 family protein n=1 Tax=Streptosporangium sp. NPDC006007 TaxID=3154575 RepID=UPI0033B03430
MSRLITSRWVRLGLVAVALTAIVVVVLRSRRSRSTPGPVSRAAPGAPPGTAPPGEAESGRVPRWPPAPILGTPTADDLRRYAVPAYIPAFLSAKPYPREPLDGAVRRRLVRWGAAACALGVLFLGAQALEDVTFSKREEPAPAGGVFGGGSSDPATFPCVPEARDTGAGTDGWTPDDRHDPICRDMGVQPPSRWGRVEIRPLPEGTSARVRRRAGSVPDADCRPSGEAPRARALSPGVTRAVNRQWTRIERWLKANAPATRRTLAPPARGRTIAIAEAQMGLRFPDDLRASLLRHNGALASGGTSGFGLLAGKMLGVREIRDTWRGLCGIGGPRPRRWEGGMIPIASDLTGGRLAVDSAGRGVAEIGEEGEADFTPGGVRIRSHYALLKRTADALEADGTVGQKPRVTGAAELGSDPVGSG